MSQARTGVLDAVPFSDDMELVRRALARDPDAFRMIMRAHNQRLYRIARGVIRNDAEAEDVVQESYVRAFTHLESFRGESSLATWLSREQPRFMLCFLDRPERAEKRKHHPTRASSGHLSVKFRRSAIQTSGR